MPTTPRCDFFLNRYIAKLGIHYIMSFNYATSFKRQTKNNIERLMKLTGVTQAKMMKS